MATASISAEPRSETGKGVARKLRAAGRVPAVVYGHAREAQALSLQTRELEKLLSSISTGSTVVELALGGAITKTLIREIQRHPFKKQILHVDFQELVAGEKVTVEISRQDRKDQPRVAIGAKLVANMIMSAGADRLLGIDFHQHQLQGFFDIPVDHLYAMPVLTAHFRKKQLKDTVIVAPDVGSAKMARGFAKRLDASLAIIDKRRPRANVSEVVNVVGEVEGRDCILADDMIDTAGTVTEAARALKRLGANDIYVCATHAVFSGPAVERLKSAPIVEVVVTDTIDLAPDRRFERLTVLSVGELLSKAIRYTHAEQSVSSLFD